MLLRRGCRLWGKNNSQANTQKKEVKRGKKKRERREVKMMKKGKCKG